ncbi:MAG: hypothetical protein AAF086_01965 [Planctomycetota bacterium]
MIQLKTTYCLLVCFACLWFTFSAFAERELNPLYPGEQVLRITQLAANDAFQRAIGINHMSSLSVSVDRGHMLNIEMRWYDKRGELDESQSRGVWEIHSDGITDRSVVLGFLDIAAQSPEPIPSRFKLFCSERDFLWLDEDVRPNGVGGFLPETLPAGKDVAILFATIEDKKYTGRDEQGNLIPQREDGWEPEREHIKIVVRAEPIDEALLTKFPFLALPASSTAYPYRPGQGERFYPWRDEQDRKPEFEAKESD